MGAVFETHRLVLCERLTAPEATLRARILVQPEANGAHGWCLAHLDAGLAAARDPAFGVAVATEKPSPPEVPLEIVRIAAGG